MSTKLERIVWINEQIFMGRYPNAHKVQERFGLHSPRVVYDDRRFMIDRLGAPIKYSRYHEGWYYEDPYFALPPVILTDQEVLHIHAPARVRAMGARARAAVEERFSRARALAQWEQLLRTLDTAAPREAPRKAPTLVEP